MPNRAEPAHAPAGALQVKLRVMLVDDHPVVRLGLAQLINDQTDMTVCCETGTKADAVDLARTKAPDVAVVDLSLGPSSGLDLVKTLKALDEDVRILVLSMHDERLFAERALRAGANGYIMKEQVARDLLNALRQVAAGRIYLSPEMTDRLLVATTGRKRDDTRTSPVERLTDREREVFALIGGGAGTREIAEGLHLSMKTIETHRARIKEKLGLKTANELVRFATTWTHRP